VREAVKVIPTLWRKFVCLAMACIFPASLIAQDSGAAMLHTNGAVFLDGNPAPASSALFKDQTVQTKKESAAKIDLSGSTVDVSPDTYIQFEPEEIFLEHGQLHVLTSRELRVRVGCLTVIPVNQDWTDYDVTDVNGKVTVASQKNDVRIESHGGLHKNRQNEHDSNIVHAGEQVTRDEKCAAADLVRPPEAIQAILSTKPAEIIGLAIVGGVTCWVLCRTSAAISPCNPNASSPDSHTCN
jgi:hypothetical protein